MLIPANLVKPVAVALAELTTVDVWLAVVVAGFVEVATVVGAVPARHWE
jgi:hypothetical protein